MTFMGTLPNKSDSGGEMMKTLANNMLCLILIFANFQSLWAEPPSGPVAKQFMEEELDTTSDEESPASSTDPILKPIWRQNRAFPFLMSFKSFQNLSPFKLGTGGEVLENDAPYPYLTPNFDPFAGKTPFEVYLINLTRHKNYRWIHAVGGDGPVSVPLKSRDIAKKISGEFAGNPQPGKDFWNAPAPSRVLTKQMAYGGVNVGQTNYIWPGHVLFEAGTPFRKVSLTSSSFYDDPQTAAVEAYQVYQLEVDDLQRIGQGDRIDNINSDTGNAFLILVYPRFKSNNQPDWKQSEWMKVVGKNSTGLKVIRKDWRKDYWNDPQFGFVNKMEKNIKFNTFKKVSVAVPMRFWSGQLQLNFALNSPSIPVGTPDFNDRADDDLPFPRNNESAAEWYAHWVARQVNQDHAAGVEFDVGRWTWGNQKGFPMDIDNDLNPDHGYSKGLNVFGLGGTLFLKKLRNLLGPNKIIQSDSVNPFSGVRDWNYLNGAQQECFPAVNDYDRFSEAFLQLRLWTQNSGYGNHTIGENRVTPLSYGFSKTYTEAYNKCTIKQNHGLISKITKEEIRHKIKMGTTPDEKNFWRECLDKNKDLINPYHNSGANSRFRMTLAANSLVGMPSPFLTLSSPDKFDPYSVSTVPSNLNFEIAGHVKWDEYAGGDLNQREWLGKPVGGLQRFIDYDVSETSLFRERDSSNSTVWHWSIDTDFKAATSGTDNRLFGAIVEKLPTPSFSILPESFFSGVRLVASNHIPALEAGKDYTIIFWAKGDDDWVYKGTSIRHVPRLLTIELPMKTIHDKIPLGVLVNKDWKQYKLSFTAANCSDAKELHRGCATEKFFFGVSEQVGNLKIKDIRLYRGSSEYWVRKFENGLVLLNASSKIWQLDLSSFEGAGCHFAKLNGVVDHRINNGEDILDHSVTIKGQDALFLRKICPD
jgi:hypothetical protein